MNKINVYPFYFVHTHYKNGQKKVKFNKKQRKIFDFAKEKYDYSKIKPISAGVKRVTDVIGGVVGMVLTAPMVIIGAAFIKMETKGPAIFKQERIGKDGKKFTMYKLRTMYNTPQKNLENVLNSNDNRITPVGKFLRKYSIDEFPQFYNIIKGDMSLVGPRPLTNYDVNKAKDYPNFVERFVVKPGAKLQYYKEELSDPKKRFIIEKNYIENWNLKKDFNILTRIVKDVIFGKNY